MQAAYGEARPLAQWPISTQEVDRQFLRVPMRSLHASLQEEKKDAVHKLADAIMKRIDGGGRRRNDEASNMLPGLKIFSPGKRTGNADVAGSEKLQGKGPATQMWLAVRSALRWQHLAMGRARALPAENLRGS